MSATSNKSLSRTGQWNCALNEIYQAMEWFDFADYIISTYELIRSRTYSLQNISYLPQYIIIKPLYLYVHYIFIVIYQVTLNVIQWYFCLYMFFRWMIIDVNGQFDWIIFAYFLLPFLLMFIFSCCHPLQNYSPPSACKLTFWWEYLRLTNITSH